MELDARLAHIETILERIDRDLFGNGQPGRLVKIENRLTEVERHPFKCEVKEQVAELRTERSVNATWMKRLEPYAAWGFRVIVLVLLGLALEKPELLKALAGK